MGPKSALHDNDIGKVYLKMPKGLSMLIGPDSFNIHHANAMATLLFYNFVGEILFVNLVNV